MNLWIPKIHLLPGKRDDESWQSGENEERKKDGHLQKPDLCRTIMRGDLSAELNDVEHK